MAQISSIRVNEYIEEPKGFVIFLGNKCPVTWKRETQRYVFDVRRIEQTDDELWMINKKVFDEKMDKEEIYLMNGTTYR